ncbi:MAG TPA: thymidylate synthase [Candidatus Saccharimonadales bacterium]|nr:thymidylate synthase [Candidatus Saccharimonadales bacterium]
MARFDSIYRSMLKDLGQKGVKEVNKRTGHETVSLPGMSFSVDLEKDGFPLLSLRKIPVKLFIAEQIWFISGTRKPEIFLRNYTKIWDDFTNPGDVVTVAYGYRWRRHFGRDQLGNLISLLENDKSSRHGVVVTWDPASDGLGGVSKSNIPCPYTFTVNIIGGRLNLMNVVRSNDMILGFPHDVAGFALLQSILAQRLGAKPGVYTHVIANAHVYDTHYSAMDELMKRPVDSEPIKLKLPEDSFLRAENKDDSLVEEIFDKLSSGYEPGEPLKGLKIVL